MYRGVLVFLLSGFIALFIVYAPMAGNRNIYVKNIVFDWFSWTKFHCNSCNNFTFRYVMKKPNVCTDNNVYLLFLVTSRPGNGIQRDAIRETWGQNTRYNGKRVLTVFAVGHGSEEENANLSSENEKHGDIIQGAFRDSYRTLTEKVMFGLKWVTESCPDVKYVVKTDDDFYNSPAHFVRYLSRESHVKFVGGRCITLRPDRNPLKKSYVSYDTYKHMYSPYYCQGGGYILSQKTVQDIVDIAANVPYNPMEDQFVVGMCRVATGTHFTQVPGLLSQKRTFCAIAERSLNVHKVDPEMMLLMWNSEQNRTICDRMVKSNHPHHQLFTSICTVASVLFVVVWSIFVRSILDIPITDSLTHVLAEIRMLKDKYMEKRVKDGPSGVITEEVNLKLES